jgi:DNA-binding GntR family transcriptional regulator
MHTMAKDRKTEALEHLKMRILTLEIAPGSDLDEAALSMTYGISRTPVREVLQRLAGEGYATQTANRGAKVASMDFAAMRCFFQTAPLVYATIARLAAEHGTPAQLDRLKAIQIGFAAAVDAGDAARAALANHAFHAMTGDMAANPYLAPSLARMLIDHTRLSQTFYRPAGARDAARVRRASDQHDAMIAAFQDRDAEEAVSLTLLHWDLSRDRMEDFVRPDPLPLQPEAADAV